MASQALSFWFSKTFDCNPQVMIPLKGGRGVGIADTRWGLKFMARSQEALLLNTFPKLHSSFLAHHSALQSAAQSFPEKKQFCILDAYYPSPHKEESRLAIKELLLGMFTSIV